MSLHSPPLAANATCVVSGVTANVCILYASVTLRNVVGEQCLSGRQIILRLVDCLYLVYDSLLLLVFVLIESLLCNIAIEVADLC